MSTVTINTSAKDQWLSFNISHSALQEIGVTIKTLSGNPYSINWGDGTIDDNLPSNSTAVHTFSSTATVFRIKTVSGLNDIIEFHSPSLNLNGQITEFRLLINLKVLRIYTENLKGVIASLNPSIEEFVTKSLIAGTSSDFPPNLRVFKLLKNGTRISGQIQDLPSTLVEIEIYQSSFSGSINDLPPNLELVNLSDNFATVSGNIGNLPITMKYFRWLGNNTMTGSIGALPNNLTFIYIAGQNTISGDFDSIPPNLTSFTIQGNNTIAGNINNIQPTLKTINIGGNNTVTGNLSNVPSTVNSLIVLGLNTIAGNIESSYIQYLTIWGNNIIGGNLASIPVVENVQQISIRGNNTIKNSNSKSFAGIVRFNLTLDPVHSSFIPTQIDQLLIDLAAVPNMKAFINLQGENAVRTPASDAAVATLLTNGGTLILP